MLLRAVTLPNLTKFLWPSSKSDISHARLDVSMNRRFYQSYSAGVVESLCVAFNLEGRFKIFVTLLSSIFVETRFEYLKGVIITFF